MPKGSPGLAGRSARWPVCELAPGRVVGCRRGGRRQRDRCQLVQEERTDLPKMGKQLSPGLEFSSLQNEETGLCLSLIAVHRNSLSLANAKARKYWKDAGVWRIQRRGENPGLGNNRDQEAAGSWAAASVAFLFRTLLWTKSAARTLASTALPRPPPPELRVSQLEVSSFWERHPTSLGWVSRPRLDWSLLSGRYGLGSTARAAGSHPVSWEGAEADRGK